MRRRDMLRWSGAAMLGMSTFPLDSAAAEKKRQKVLYFTRSVGYEHSVVKRTGGQLSHSERILTKLGRQHGFEVDCTKDGRVFDRDLVQYDTIAFYSCGDPDQPSVDGGPPISPVGKKRLLDAIDAGKGFVGIHSTCYSYYSKGPKFENQEQVDPFIAMLGGEFIEHAAQQEATMRIAAPEFPGLTGLSESFKMLDEWYALKNFAKDLHVILVQETKGMKGDCYHRPPFPSTWSRVQKKGRVFYTAMGHREDVWTSGIFQQILLGGLAWTMRTADADVTPNIRQVAPKANRLRHPR